MAFTAVSEDVIVQEGTFAFDYDCSGTVYAGQGVCLCGTMKVKAPNGAGGFPKGCVGVAAYGQTDGNKVAVYGPGNIVRVIASGTSIAYGDTAFVCNDGYFLEVTTPYYMAASGVKAIALESQGTNKGETRVLLV